jgi:hypothetical protein
MVKEVISFAHATREVRYRLTNTGSRHYNACLGLGLRARFGKLSIGQQSSKQQTNNNQQIAAFHLTNPGENTALAFIKQIHVMQFYITKNFT